MTASAPSSRQCGEYGLVPDRVAPGDASVAIRSFARRCRELLPPAGVADREIVSHRPAPGSWSALEHVVHLADTLHMAAGCLAKVRTLDRPPLGQMRAVRPGGVQHDQKLEIALARLTDSCSRLAGEIDQTRAEDWSRVAVRKGKEVSALELAREAVHEGAHHLRDDRVCAVGGAPNVGAA